VPLPSTGSNLGPTNPALAAAFAERAAELRAAGIAGPIPVDLLTSSASGLDPHVSPAAARAQVERVARARSLDPARVRALVDAHVEERLLGLFGEARVNVLALNLALERLK
jgi:K+-transporting ATPase ATPase C chain